MPTDFKVQVHNPAWVATEVAPELIGRDQELAEVVAALHVHALVTLVGSGGIGKTSLAMAVAYAVADQFAAATASGSCRASAGERKPPLTAHT